METYAYGFPRLGKNREYKRVIEDYWNDKISETQLQQRLSNLENSRFTTYERFVDKFPVGEFSLYDNMLDTAIMLGLYEAKNLKEYFDLCRGKNALELTKWFNTNYHYLVPVIPPEPYFRLNWNKPKEALEKYKKGTPYLIGPFTFLKLSKGVEKKKFGDYLLAIGKIYHEIIKDFAEVHIDEPAFVLEVSAEERESIKTVYQLIACGQTGINLFTYYESVDFLKDLYELPVQNIGLDFVNGKETLRNVQKNGFPSDKILIAGLVNGRNVWRTNITECVKTLKELSKYANNLMVSSSGPLYHLPITIQGEKLDPGLLKNLAFAEEKLSELQLVAKAYDGERIEERPPASEFGVNEEVRKKIKSLQKQDFQKPLPYAERKKLQKEKLNLPLFPTTVIGSFPQTGEVRKKRAKFKTGEITEEQYKSFIKKKLSETIKLQEQLGLDVLVHGEFERTDMVEFFAQKLNGIATTANGWIISYGTRGYRPPIIYGDISRPSPMTVEEISYAQSLTTRPVKGILTGPVTILAWSFVREDIPIKEVAYQIALCLQDEINDYERARIKIVQIDEPAFREKAPLKKRIWDEYFDWAVKSFRLATSHSQPETQIHTHMCYSEFGEIIDKIVQMDFDVISIEATRSNGDIIASFEKINFDRQIGLGVWDIHSPAVPSVEEMKKTIARALKVIPKENFWINPDCGLKTREWEEAIPSLKNLVTTAKELRQRFPSPQSSPQRGEEKR